MAAYLCPNTECREHDIPKGADYEYSDPVHCGACDTVCGYDPDAVSDPTYIPPPPPPGRT